MRLINGIICTEKGLKKGFDIIIRNEKIYLENSRKQKSDERCIDLKGKYVFPGFIELHTHGAGLFSFYAGKYNTEKRIFESSGEIYQEGLEKWAKLRVKTGTTSLYPSTAAIPLSRIKFILRELEKFVKNNRN
ncbi:MAG: hypothetical protein N2115_03065, partial [bacterium]|nr:hypothetical protein [bacterium]